MVRRCAQRHTRHDWLCPVLGPASPLVAVYLGLWLLLALDSSTDGDDISEGTETITESPDDLANVVAAAALRIALLVLALDGSANGAQIDSTANNTADALKNIANDAAAAALRIALLVLNRWRQQSHRRVLRINAVDFVIKD